MSFFIDTEPEAASGRDAEAEAAAGDKRKRKRREEQQQQQQLRRQQQQQQQQQRILFRAVSAGALGAGASSVADTATAAANGNDEEQRRPRAKRARFSRQALNARFFDSGRVSDEAAGGFGQGRFKAGEVSDALRAACGLRPLELPPWVYRMRVMGYPPGWLKEATDHGSGIAIIDDSAVAEAPAEEAAAKYDVRKLVEFPGFNCPLPAGVRDEHRRHGCPPMQLQHHLSAFVQRLRSENRAQDGDAYHTRTIRQKQQQQQQQQLDMELESSGDETELQELEARRQELLRQLEAGELQEIDSCSGSDEEAGAESPEAAAPASPRRKSPQESQQQQQQSPPPHEPPQQQSQSIGSEFGSPVFASYATRLPDAANFNRGIEEFKPFENLPNSTGSFQKVNAVVRKIRKFLPRIS